MIRGYTDVLRLYWPMLLFGLLTVSFSNFGQSFFIGWFGAPIQAELGLSASAYGSIYSVANLIGGLGIMVIGGVIDRFSLRLIVTLIALGLVIACLLMWRINSIASLVIALIMLRFFGHVLMPHAAMTAMGRYFSVNRGKAVSVAGSGLSLGEMILPTLWVLIITQVGWQNSWLIVALVVSFLYLPAAHWLLGKSGTSEVERLGVEKRLRPNDIPDGSRRTVLKDKRFWLALPLLLAPGFIVTGIFIQQAFVLNEKGWGSALFAASFIVYGGAHWVTSLVTGTLIDRYSAVHLLIFLGVPLFLGLVLTGIFEGEWVVFVMMAMLGIGIGMAGTIMNALWAEIYGTTHLGAIRSLVTAFGVLSTTASPILLGLMIDSGVSVTALLWSMAAFVLCSLIMAWQSFRV